MALQWPGAINTSVIYRQLPSTPQDLLFQNEWAECGISFGHSCLACFFPEMWISWKSKALSLMSKEVLALKGTMEKDEQQAACNLHWEREFLSSP